MKTIKLFIAAISFLLQLPVFAQVQIDHEIQLTGSGTDAKITGIQSVTNGPDATSAQVVQSGSMIYATSTGSNNSFNLTINPPIPAYQKGMVFNFISNQAINGPATLQVNNLAAVTIKKYISQDLGLCEIQNGQVVTVVYDGANFQETSLLPSAPVLTSSLTPPAICSGSTFNYSPMCSLTGATFSWSRPAVAGISNSAASGTGNPDEILDDTSASPVNVTYVYTITTANGCNVPYNVVVTVNPVPTLTSSPTPPAICSGNTFNYSPMCSLTGATFSWSRPAVAGISNSAASGTGNPDEILDDTSASPVNVTYVYTITTANGCNATYNVVVTVNPGPTTKGLIGYWPFEGNANDTSGNGNNGTATAVTYGTSYGVFGQGAHFDGSSSYISVSNSASLNTYITNNALTVTAWVMFSSGNAIIHRWSSPSFTMEVLSGDFTFVISTTTAGYQIFSSGLTMPIGQWVFLAETYDGTTMRTYANGVAQDSSTVSSPLIGSTSQMNFMKRTDNNTYTAGNLDEVRIYNRALSASEIQTLYTSTCQ